MRTDLPQKRPMVRVDVLMLVPLQNPEWTMGAEEAQSPRDCPGGTLRGGVEWRSVRFCRRTMRGCYSSNGGPADADLVIGRVHSQ